MKQKLNYVWILFLAMIFLLGCVPNPQTSPVLNQHEVFEEKSFQLKTEEQDLLSGFDAEDKDKDEPVHVEKSYETKRGISITFDADVIVPKPQEIPLVHVRACALPENQIHRILDYFFADRPIYDASHGVPEISESSLIASDRTTLHDVFDIVSPSNRAGWARLSVRDEREDGLYNILFTDYGWNGCYTDHQQGDAAGLPFSEQEAWKNAQTILNELKITDMQLSRTSYGYAYDYDTLKRSNKVESVRFILTRSISNIAQPNSDGFAWYEQFALENSAEYNKPWQSEYLAMEFDQKGLVSFSWYNPVEISEIVNDNIEVISLDQALENFDYVIDTFYSYYVSHDTNIWGDWSENLLVTKIQFGYQFRRIKDVPDEFELVPCCVFYQNDGRKILVLNAVDGTIFNSGLHGQGQNGR